MDVLITGAKGFVGRNLVETLKTVRDGKNRCRPGLRIGEILEYGHGDSDEELARLCERADFVVHLAGANRPADPSEFQAVNSGFTEHLLDTLRDCGNRCPVLFSSSVQASLVGRYRGEYGLSKRMGEEHLFRHAEETGAKTLVYRFPNLAGKWSRPHYNSVVATFCHNIANGLPITIHDPKTELELLFIDDLIEELLDALEGKEHRCEWEGLRPRPTPTGAYCYAPVTHRVTLERLAACLYGFYGDPLLLCRPSFPDDPMERKLYAMSLSYLPAEKLAVPHPKQLPTAEGGRCSSLALGPGQTEGPYWHNRKGELCTAVSGRGLLTLRRIGTEEILRFELDGGRAQAVRIPPGCVHSLQNLSGTGELTARLWASEEPAPERPDSFYEPI